jgi:hypothetical protein
MQAKAGKAVSKIEPTIGGSVYVKPNTAVRLSAEGGVDRLFVAKG